MYDIMVDLETLSTDSNGVILSVALVEFDLKTGKVGLDIELAIDVQQQLQNGAIADLDTCVWWLTQSPTAIKEQLKLKRYSVDDACLAISDYISSLSKDASTYTLWGNGATFDNVMLRNLFKRHNHSFPLSFWQDNDVRTLVNLSGISPKDFKFEGTQHKALADCKHQIKYCHAGYKELK